MKSVHILLALLVSLTGISQPYTKNEALIHKKSLMEITPSLDSLRLYFKCRNDLTVSSYFPGYMAA